MEARDVCCNLYQTVLHMRVSFGAFRNQLTHTNRKHCNPTMSRICESEDCILQAGLFFKRMSTWNLMHTGLLGPENERAIWTSVVEPLPFVGNDIKWSILTSRNWLHPCKFGPLQWKETALLFANTGRGTTHRPPYFISQIRHTLNTACPRYVGSKARLIISRPFKQILLTSIGLGRGWRQFLSARARNCE